MDAVDPRPSWTVLLLAPALLLGGLREPRLAALGEAVICAALWLERPALGPAFAWFPWLAWASLAALAGPEPLAAPGVLARWFAALGFASIAANWTARDRTTWLMTVLIVAEILALASVTTGARFAIGWTMTGLMPPYYNYTMFTLAAAAAAGTAWSMHPRASGTRQRAAALAIAALCVACIWRAHSRGAVLGLGAAAAVWSLRRWGKRAGGAIAGMALAGALSLSLTPVRGFFLKSDRRFAEVRPQIWRAAAKMAAERPWLGFGPGAFGVGFAVRPVALEKGVARWGMSTDYAHSEFLQVAAETGWLGLLLWLIGLGSSLRVLLRRAGPEPAREAAAAAVAAMLPQMIADNMLQLPGLSLLFFSATAVGAESKSRTRRWTRTGAAAGAALTLTAWLPRAIARGSPERAAVLFPAEAGPREDLAYRAMRAGRWTEADRLWSEAAVRAPFDAVYPWRRAQIAAAQGRWADVEALAATAAALEPGFSDARILRAEALARLGRRAQARAELAAVLRRRENVPDAPILSGYDATIAHFDPGEFKRATQMSAEHS